MENKLVISLSPHVHGGDSVKKNMYGVLIALIPAFLVSLYFFGLGALIVTATSVAACLFFEWAIGKFLMKKETTTICDGSAVITGVLLAFNLPSNLPIWIIILGALFAIGVGKMSFGGLGNNPFNPALAGRVFLLLSFPVQMTSWPVVGQLTNDLFTLDDEDGFYLAVFNYERTMNKKYNIDLERIGLEKDTEYSVTDMWSGKNMQVKDIMSIELHPEESSIYKIKRGNNR